MSVFFNPASENVSMCVVGVTVCPRFACVRVGQQFLNGFSLKFCVNQSRVCRVKLAFYGSSTVLVFCFCKKKVKLPHSGACRVTCRASACCRWTSAHCFSVKNVYYNSNISCVQHCTVASEMSKWADNVWHCKKTRFISSLSSNWHNCWSRFDEVDVSCRHVDTSTVWYWFILPCLTLWHRTIRIPVQLAEISVWAF